MLERIIRSIVSGETGALSKVNMSFIETKYERIIADHANIVLCKSAGLHGRPIRYEYSLKNRNDIVGFLNINVIQDKPIIDISCGYVRIPCYYGRIEYKNAVYQVKTDDILIDENYNVFTVVKEFKQKKKEKSKRTINNPRCLPTSYKENIK